MSKQTRLIEEGKKKVERIFSGCDPINDGIKNTNFWLNGEV